jgi:hypothetical protein
LAILSLTNAKVAVENRFVFRQRFRDRRSLIAACAEKDEPALVGVTGF